LEELVRLGKLKSWRVEEARIYECRGDRLVARKLGSWGVEEDPKLRKVLFGFSL